MPGSAADPVRLDPFRTIIEVGWRTRYLAVQVDFRGSWDPWPIEACGDPEVVVGLPGTEDWTPTSISGLRANYLSETGIPMNAPTDQEKIRQIYAWKGQWIGLDWGEYEISGLPNLPTDGALSVGQWMIRTSNAFELPLPAATITPPADVPVPGSLSDMFDEDLTPHIDFTVNTFIGDIACAYFFGNPDAAFIMGKYNPSTSTYGSSISFAAGGITVTYKGNTFEPLATKLVSPASLIILLGNTDL